MFSFANVLLPTERLQIVANIISELALDEGRGKGRLVTCSTADDSGQKQSQKLHLYRYRYSHLQNTAGTGTKVGVVKGWDAWGKSGGRGTRDNGWEVKWSRVGGAAAVLS